MAPVHVWSFKSFRSSSSGANPDAIVTDVASKWFAWINAFQFDRGKQNERSGAVPFGRTAFWPTADRSNLNTIASLYGPIKASIWFIHSKVLCNNDYRLTFNWNIYASMMSCLQFSALSQQTGGPIFTVFCQYSSENFRMPYLINRGLLTHLKSFVLKRVHVPNPCQLHLRISIQVLSWPTMLHNFFVQMGDGSLKIFIKLAK